jgi:hypothetical protein
MKEYVIEDEYGRRATFVADMLVTDTTDTEEGSKPRYVNLTVWRTKGGKYVVHTETHFRIWHLDENCRRATREGAILRPAQAAGDTFPCPTCHNRPAAPLGTGYGQVTRHKQSVYDSPQALIDGLRTVNNQTGETHHSRFAQSLLADISEVDQAVADLWMNVVVE